MTKGCAVPKCRTGYKTCKLRRSVFKVPRNHEKYMKWRDAVPGLQLKQSQFVCERHFEEKYIVRKWINRDAHVELPYKHPRLNENAIPTLFQTDEEAAEPLVYFAIKENLVPTTLQSNEEQVDRSIDSLVSTARLSDCSNVSSQSPSLMDEDAVNAINISHKASSCIKDENIPLPCTLLRLDCTPKQDFEETPENLVAVINHAFDAPKPVVRNRDFEMLSITLKNGSTELVTNANSTISIPKRWSFTEVVRRERSSITFFIAALKQENGADVTIIERSVSVDSDNELQYNVYGKAVNIEKTELARMLNDTALLPQILNTFGCMNLCHGLGTINVQHLSADEALKDCSNRWRDNECLLLSKTKRCDSCLKARQRISRREKRAKSISEPKRVLRASNPIDQKKIQALQKRNDRVRHLKNRAKHRFQLLRTSGNQIASVKAEMLDEKCLHASISGAQKTVLSEIIAAASKKCNNRRYSEEWVMMCILMNIRSPTYYEFLRRNNILPLPCKKTIRNYFSLMNMKCGFDKKFGEVLKKHFNTKANLQHHGVLLLDEISVRKSVTVCAKNLSYVGLTDMGDGATDSTDTNDQATHGLVIMYQSLGDSFTQPVAVFASKNQVKGDELSKIILQAIAFLENTGAKIHGIIGDGAATNGKMRLELGVSGEINETKTWFEHPLDDNRKVFIFSYTPHLFKCIRNRLYKNKKLRMKSSDAYIRWEYFNSLFNVDTVHAANARVCPKITQQHVVVDGISKMRVRLATQIFSKSVAAGLKLYSMDKTTKEHFVGCEETIKFCEWMNDLFDALNIKSPNRGLKPDSEDFKILHEGLQKLNDWESAREKGDILSEECLTPETARGLRMSLISTMDMCEYLIDKFKFKYLLTGKVNVLYHGKVALA